ncbi:MAG: TetR/AcrR family transcriptional regulator [Firmicutes bacterium]|nr:TetR/AcrR family transcriptional regulator [Bacillota bacterium]
MARKKDPEGAKAQILAAALQLFSEKGYEATTMQNIVELSGLSKGAIYYHFRDKSEIYKGLYEDLNRKPFSCFEELDKDETLTAPEKLEAAILHLIMAPEKNIYAEAVRGQKNPDLVELTLRISVLEASPFIAKLLEEGIREGFYPPGDTQMIAEFFCLTVDMWLDPCINQHTTPEQFERKMDIIQKTFELHGYPIVTSKMREAVKLFFLPYK